MKKILFSAMMLGAILGSNFALAQTETSGRNAPYGEEWLTASPHFYASDSLVLNAKAMLIHEIALDKNGSKSPLKYTYSDDLLRINLDKQYQKGQDYTVYIKYTARPNEHKGKGSAAINSAKGLYFINAQ